MRAKSASAKIGTEVAHVTRDSDTTFKVKSSRSPGRFAHCHVGATGGCSGGRGNELVVGNCCYFAVCSAAQGASAPMGEERGGGISWRPPTYSLLLLLQHGEKGGSKRSYLATMPFLTSADGESLAGFSTASDNAQSTPPLTSAMYSLKA